MSRWIKLHTSIFEHGLFSGKEFSEREAWVWLIVKAAWKETTHRVAGSVLPVPPGSLFATLRELQHAWRWGSDYRVRAFLKLLENERMIVVNSNAGKTRITICNYAAYQHVERTENAEKTQDATHGKRKENALKEEGLEIIENIDSFEREHGREKDFDLEGFQKWFAAWPTVLTDDEVAAESEWSKLSPEQRASAAAETPKFIEGVRASKRTVFPTAAKFLAKRLWERVAKMPPPPPKPLTPAQQKQADNIAIFDAVTRGQEDSFIGKTIDARATQSSEDRQAALEKARREYLEAGVRMTNSWG